MVKHLFFEDFTLQFTSEGSELMGWKTLYATGRSGFASRLVDALDASGENFLPGSSGENDVYMFWVTEHFSLSKLKIALGSKRIFKYRLRFFNDVSTFTLFTEKNRKKNFTPDQEQAFREFN